MADTSQQPPASKNRSNLVSLAINILETEKQFHFLSILGQGTYGDVFRMYDPGRDQDIAVKIVTPENISEKELVFWPKLRHRNIVPLLEVLTLGPWSTSVFVMPLQRKNLHDVLCDKRFLLRRGCFNKVKEWLFEVLSALEYIRSKQFCHLDIKVDNVLISQRSTAMLCDFSFLNVTITPLKRYDLGLPFIYRPPEACQSLGKKVRIDGRSYDMWGYGVMVVEILTHFVLASNIPDSKCWNKDVYPTLFDALQETQFAKALVRTFPADPIDQHDIKLGLNFIQSFLVKDYLNRISPNEAMRHMFLNHGTFTGWIVDPMWIYKELDTPIYVEKATQTIDVPSEEDKAIQEPNQPLESTAASDTSEDQYLTLSETETEEESDDEASEIQEEEEMEEEKSVESLGLVKVEDVSPSPSAPPEEVPETTASSDLPSDAFSSYSELPHLQKLSIPSPKSDTFSNYGELSNLKEINIPEKPASPEASSSYSELRDAIKQNEHSCALKSEEVSNESPRGENEFQEVSQKMSNLKIESNDSHHESTGGALKEILGDERTAADYYYGKNDVVVQRERESDITEAYRIFKQHLTIHSTTDVTMDGGSKESRAELSQGYESLQQNLYQKARKEVSRDSTTARKREIEDMTQQGSLENPLVVFEVLEGATGDNTVSNLEEASSRPQCSPLSEVKEPYLSVSNEVRDLRGRLGELDKMFEELEKTLVCEECSEKYGPEEPCRETGEDVSIAGFSEAPSSLEARSEAIRKCGPEEGFGQVTQRQSFSKQIPSCPSDVSTVSSGSIGRGKKLKKWLRERCLNLERFAQKKPYRILK